MAAAWFNTAAFVPNGPGLGIGPYGVDGNTPRDFLRSPGYKDVDLGIFRTVSLWEHVRLELRAEAINAFNTPILLVQGYVTDVFGGSNFGVINTSEGARNLQFALKFHF